MAEAKQIEGSGGLDVRVVTPQGTICETKTSAVKAPGRLGEFEILPGHVPLLAELHPGVLSLGDKGREHYAVAAGYLKVGHLGDIEILVEKAVAGGDVDGDQAKASLDELAPKLEGWDKPIGADHRTLSDQLRWAEAQLEARRASAS